MNAESLDRPSHLLVVANQTCPCPALLDHVHSRAADADAEVLIVAPALSPRLKHWASDTDASVEGARQRLAEATDGLTERGIKAKGTIGDSEPLRAIEDALATFPAQEILIGTHPPESSHWLEKGLIDRARSQFEIPVLHIESRYGLVVA